MVSDEEGLVIYPPDDFITIYKELFRLGLRFSLHPFIANILDWYEVIPTQLALNFFWILACFIVLCYLLRVEPRISLF